MMAKSRKVIIQGLLKAHSMCHACKLLENREAYIVWLSQLCAYLDIALDVSYYENDEAMLAFYRACKRVIE